MSPALGCWKLTIPVRGNEANLTLQTWYALWWFWSLLMFFSVQNILSVYLACLLISIAQVSPSYVLTQTRFTCVLIPNKLFPSLLISPKFFIYNAIFQFFFCLYLASLDQWFLSFFPSRSSFNFILFLCPCLNPHPNSYPLTLMLWPLFMRFFTVAPLKYYRSPPVWSHWCRWTMFSSIIAWWEPERERAQQ